MRDQWEKYFKKEIMLDLLFILIFQNCFASRDWSKALSEIPQEARQVIEMHLKCSSFGVEDFEYPTEKSLKEYEINRCKFRFKKNEKIRKKYNGNIKVVNLLDCADMSISHPDQCPD